MTQDLDNSNTQTIIEPLPKTKRENTKTVLSIVLAVVVAISIYMLYAINNKSGATVQSVFNYTSDSPIVRSMDGGQAPAWMPFIGKATVGCTTGNPHPNASGCKTKEGGPYHPWPAIDYHMPAGKPIRASAPGVVVRVNQNPTEDEDDPNASSSPGEGGVPTSNPDALEARAGFYVGVRHINNSGSVYKHLSEAMVREGESVERGQIIGLAGKTASPTYHLHYDEQQYIEKDDDRFNSPESRTPLGNMLGWANGQVRTYPGYLGYSNWEQVPYKTVVNTIGYGTEPVDVTTRAELQQALNGFANSTAEGPFIVRVTQDMAIPQPVVYRGDELLIIQGTGQNNRVLTSSGKNSSRILTGLTDAPIEINNITMQDGRSIYNGGAVWTEGSLSIVESKFKRNSSDHKGGAIYAQGDVSISRVQLSDNTAVEQGGAIYAKSIRAAESTLNRNQGLSGGAIYSLGATDASNTTFSKNTATTTGGGIASEGRIQIRHVTMKENRAPAGASLYSPSNLVALASVSANPLDSADCDVSETVVFGYNVEEGTSCDFEIQNIQDTGLGELSWNGGFTPTYLPNSNSILRNAYPSLPKFLTGYKHPTVCDTTSAIDQRGAPLTWTESPPTYSRPQGQGCDIGAVDIE